MKIKTVIFTGTIVLTFFATQFACANSITNGGFEDGTGYDADYWNGDGSADIGRTNAQSRTGSYSINISANWDWANLNQVVNDAGLQGKDVILKAYGLTPSSDPLSANSGILKMEWIGASGSAETWFIDGNSSQDTWVEGVVTGTAPTGATAVRIVLMKANAASGRVFFDDVDVTIIPEPVSVILFAAIGLFLFRKNK